GVAQEGVTAKTGGKNLGQIKTAVKAKAKIVAEAAAKLEAGTQVPPGPVAAAVEIAAGVAEKATNYVATKGNNTGTAVPDVQNELTGGNFDEIKKAGASNGKKKGKELAEGDVPLVAEAAAEAAALSTNGVAKAAFDAKAAGKSIGEIIAAAYAK